MNSKQEIHNEGVGKEFEIYTSRFTPREEEIRQNTWEVLVKEFFQAYVPENGVVLDIGAGDGLFTKNIRARKKIAVDLSAHVKELEKLGVEVHQERATAFHNLISEKADVIFMSNFLEHLPNKQVLLEVFQECRRALKPGGIVMILQPNIRYVGPAYWDYVDHHIPLTEFSLIEGLEVCGFSVHKVIPRFLPYTSKSSLGKILSPEYTKQVVHWYLRLPWVWRLLGGQTFVVAKPRLGPV